MVSINPMISQCSNISFNKTNKQTNTHTFTPWNNQIVSAFPNLYAEEWFGLSHTSQPHSSYCASATDTSVSQEEQEVELLNRVKDK